MPSFSKLLVLAALAAVSSATAIANVVERAAASGHNCAEAKLAHNVTVDVGGHPVTLTSFECNHAPAAAVARRDLFDEPPLCILLGTCKSKPTPTPSPTSAPAPAPTKNVCGQPCTTTCNNIEGILPPTSQDCDIIGASIAIFANTTSTFVVDADHLTTLTFGTCSYFFTNSGTESLEYCWSDLNSTAVAVGAACFPPVHPFFPSGLCASYDQTWGVGAAHS